LTEEKPTIAYVLSLIAGFLIVLGRLVSSAFIGMMRDWHDGWAGMMGGYGMMSFPIWGRSMAFGIVGMITGIIVIIGAVMLSSRPRESRTLGTIILVFSILSLFGGLGGFGIGAILGIIGGALAISWAPTPPAVISTQQPTKYCVQCGQAMAADADYCFKCGKNNRNSARAR